MKSDRHQRLAQLLHEHDTLTTGALAQMLAVSPETVRRDLRLLQRQGLILRSHGQACILREDRQSHDAPFSARLKSHHSHKLDIARLALEWVSEGMVIALDASTTCWYLARQLPDMPLTVFTNSVRVCQEVAKRQRIRLISSGGVLDRTFASYENPALLSLLRQFDIDLFIFSCQGIDSEGGIWDARAWNADFKTLLLRRAAQSLLLIDKSKRERTGEVQIGTLAQVTEVITDETASARAALVG